MARTLTGSATTAKEGQYLAFDVLVESEDLDLRYSFTTENAGGHSWEHRLIPNGISDIVYEGIPGGGLASVSTVRLLVIDDGAGKSPTAILNDMGLIRGADLSISILFGGETYANKIPIYTSGTIDDYRRDGMITELIAVDGTFFADRLMPLNVVPQNDPNAADSAIGRALPLVYGDGADVLLAPLLFTDKTTREYKAASHEMKAIGASTSGDFEPSDFESSDFDVATTDANYAIYVETARQAKARSGDATVSEASASITLSVSLSEILFGAGTTALAVERQQDVSNSANAIDGDSGTVATINTDSNTDANGEGYGYLGVSGAWATPEGNDILQIAVDQHRGNASAAATVNAQFKLRLIDSGGVVLRDDLLNTGEFRFFSNPRDFAQELRGVTLETGQRIELLIEVFNEGGLGGVNDNWDVGEVSLTLGTQAPGDQAQLYLYNDWQGRPDDVVGTYTGTANLLIEKPPDVIWSIAAGDLGLTVDSAAMSTARSRLTSWLFAGGIGAGWFQERSLARELLDSLARQCKAILFPSDNGLKLLPFNSGDASQYTFDASTILWSAGTPVDSLPAQRQSTFRINQEPIAEIFNVFEIRYAYDAGGRKFNKLRYCNPDGTNSAKSDASDILTLCVNSANRYGRSGTYVIEADFIYDDDTADLLLDHVVRYLWEYRISAEWETGTQALHLELGDFVTINYADLPQRLQSATFELHRLVYRFVPVTSPSGQLSLSFRVGCTASRLSQVNFHYLQLLDQSDVPHYWWIGTGPTLLHDTTVPAQPGLTGIDLGIGSVYWLEFSAIDTPATTIYAWPHDVNGTFLFDTSPPPIGTGYVAGSGIAMTGIDGVGYTLEALTSAFPFIE